MTDDLQKAERSDLPTEPEPGPAEPPLCVDLDGTLIDSDTLLESLFVLLKTNPLMWFMLPIWLLRGKANLKNKVAQLVDLDVDRLPYNQAFRAYLCEQQKKGRRLVLVTASNQKIAQKIAEQLDLFESTFASDAIHNLSGLRKREQLCEAFGEGGFDYAGNANVDLDVWRHARRAILVNASPALRAAASAQVTVDCVFPGQTRSIRDYLKAIRPHQWLKNLLLFVPLVAAHQVEEFAQLSQVALAFVAFGFCASSTYVCNDLLDLAADRSHPSKRNRPFAAGRIPLMQGLALVPLLLICGLVTAMLLPLEFVSFLVGYYLITIAYSLWLKKILFLDVLVLAGLYTIRVIAGGTAVAVPISFYLLAFSMFFFIGLAMMKRYSELLELREQGKRAAPGRSYLEVDAEILISLGPASGYISVLILALYINSENVRLLYSRPDVIWLLCPLVLYWISRVWIMTGRGEMLDDPVLYAIRDRASHWIGAACVVVVLLAV